MLRPGQTHASDFQYLVTTTPMCTPSSAWQAAARERYHDEHDWRMPRGRRFRRIYRRLLRRHHRAMVWAQKMRYPRAPAARAGSLA